MSRLVEPADPGARAFAGRDPKEAATDYAERVAKYVPVEIIAAYLALQRTVTGSTDADTTLRTTLLAVILFGLAILTPLYLWFMAEAGKPKRIHIILGTIGFFVWAYSIGGYFTDIGLYHEAIADITLVFYSIISGFFIPTKGTP
jgi:hypothetical protein